MEEVIDHRLNALDDDASEVHVDAYEDAYVDDVDDVMEVVVPYCNHRPSSVQNAYVVADDLAVEVVYLDVDPY